jgi:predicted SnoaL-like aldol condensation-catalyzing enzyme
LVAWNGRHARAARYRSTWSRTTKETVRRYYAEVWAKGDPAPLEEFLTNDYVDHNPAPGMSGDKAGAAQVVTSVMADTADVEMDMGHVIGEGDFLADRSGALPR